MIPKWRVPSQKKWIVLLFSATLLITACSRDLIFSDELMDMYKGDELLKISYQVEQTEYREFLDSSNPLAKTRSVPITSKQRYDFSMNRAGQVETFLEVLKPSESFEINESLPSTSKEVKFVQYQNGKLKSYDDSRSLIGEAEVPYLKEEYAKLFSNLSEKSKNKEDLQIQISGGIIWDMSLLNNTTNSTNNQSNSRTLNALQGPYDNHEDFRVVRNEYVAEDGKTYTTELIIHKPSNTLRFMTDYDQNLEAISRVFFTYKNVDGKPHLEATHEENLIEDEYSGESKQIIISQYDFFNINLNL